MKPFRTLKSALAYARFRDPEIKSATHELIATLEKDLTAADYNEGELVEEATTALETAIAEADERMSEKVDDDEDEEDEL